MSLDSPAVEDDIPDGWGLWSLVCGGPASQDDGMAILGAASHGSRRHAHRPSGAGLLRRSVLAALIGLLGLFAMPEPAGAHGGDETQEGYRLVQQALAHLAHDSTPAGIDLANEKIDDAIAAPDHDGVAVAEVAQAKIALEAGRVEQARAMLQDSIRQALADQPPATGAESGTTLIVPEMPGRIGLHGQDWILLAGSVVLLFVGVGLAFRFRPPDSVRELRRQLLARRRLVLQGPSSTEADAEAPTDHRKEP